MSENKPSIKRIVDDWVERHNKNIDFKPEVAPAALEDLMEVLVYNGYLYYDIHKEETYIRDSMIGSWSKYPGGYTRWKIQYAKIVEKAARKAFEGPVPLPEGKVDIPFQLTVSTESGPLPEVQNNEPSYDESNDIEETEKQEYAGNPIFAPELDLSRFKDIETPPMMSGDEFFAMLEREKNER